MAQSKSQGIKLRISVSLVEQKEHKTDNDQHGNINDF